MQVNTRAALGQLIDMDLRLLRVFKSVVKCGGMEQAELELNIGISTVSRHIKDLPYVAFIRPIQGGVWEVVDIVHTARKLPKNS